MKFDKLIMFALAMLWSVSAYAQQQSPQPLTFWSSYAVNPGKEEEFLNLVKTVGAPVRDKMMADGVILAWGLESSMLRGHDTTTHTVWYAVADWAGYEKVQTAFGAQLAKIAADDAKPADKKGQKPGMTTADRIRGAVDVSKTKDYLTRDLVIALGTNMSAGMLPYTRYNFVKVRPGEAAEYRATWEKYNKPVLDKLLADGTILAFGLTVEELKTTGDATHFTWYAMKSLDGMDKVRNAFNADRDRRSAEERAAINAAFLKEIDPDASRSEMDHSIIFRLPGQN
jgi:hypothetical protein